MIFTNVNNDLGIYFCSPITDNGPIKFRAKRFTLEVLLCPGTVQYHHSHDLQQYLILIKKIIVIKFQFKPMVAKMVDIEPQGWIPQSGFRINRKI